MLYMFHCHGKKIILTFKYCIKFSILFFLAINIGLVIIPIVQEFAITLFGICICLIGFGIYFIFIYPKLSSSTLTSFDS